MDITPVNLLPVGVRAHLLDLLRTVGAHTWLHNGDNQGEGDGVWQAEGRAYPALIRPESD